MSSEEASPSERKHTPIAYFEVTLSAVSPIEEQARHPEEVREDLDNALIKAWEMHEAEFTSDVIRVAQLVVGPETQVRVNGRHGTLIIEVVLLAFAAAKTFREIVELVDFFSEFLRKRTWRLSEGIWVPPTAAFRVDVIGSPAWGATRAGDASLPQGDAPRLAGLASDAAMKWMERKLTAVLLFAGLVVLLAFTAFVLSLLLD